MRSRASATSFFFFSLITAPFFSTPATMRSRASAISSLETSLRLRRAAKMAASFMRFCRSAPVMPGVRRATFSLARTLPLECTFRMRTRPARSGRSTVTWRSKRPGRSRALSSTSGRLVAASTITPVLPSKPSSSVRSWLMVCSRSSFPPPMPVPRWRPTASISSMKMMQGALALAFSKRSRTRGAHAHEELDELGGRAGEEGHAGLAGDRLGEQGLARAGRPHEEAALGDLGAQVGVLVRVLQEVDDLLELQLGAVHAGDVLEGDPGLGDLLELGARLAELHGAAHAAHAGDL